MTLRELWDRLRLKAPCYGGPRDGSWVDWPRREMAYVMASGIVCCGYGNWGVWDCIGDYRYISRRHRWEFRPWRALRDGLPPIPVFRTFADPRDQ